MTIIECPRESDVLDAIDSRRWPHRVDRELVEHVAVLRNLLGRPRPSPPPCAKITARPGRKPTSLRRVRCGGAPRCGPASKPSATRPGPITVAYGVAAVAALVLALAVELVRVADGSRLCVVVCVSPDDRVHVAAHASPARGARRAPRDRAGRVLPRALRRITSHSHRRSTTKIRKSRSFMKISCTQSSSCVFVCFVSSWLGDAAGQRGSWEIRSRARFPYCASPSSFAANIRASSGLRVL